VNDPVVSYELLAGGSTLGAMRRELTVATKGRHPPQPGSESYVARLTGQATGDARPVPTTLENLPEWLTCSQVATLTQLSERSVDRAISTGRLEAAKTNGSVRIHRRAVRRWLVPSPDR
jgi:excisionase family DNA binding protein